MKYDIDIEEYIAFLRFELAAATALKESITRLEAKVAKKPTKKPKAAKKAAKKGGKGNV